MIKELDYWYGGQVRRYLEQVVRAFSGYQYMTGWRNGEEPQLKMVPCRMDTRDRLVGHIMRNNSENALLAVPMVTVAQTGFRFDPERVQSPSHVDTIQVHERERDQDGNYTGRPGNKYTVQRLMPRPFTLTVQIDIWTSNLDQKHQLLEQMLTVVTPGFEIQNSDNPIDWTAKTTAQFEDVNWSSRSIPIGQGGEGDLEIATITMMIPMWLSPPAKLTQQRVIEKVIANIHEGQISDNSAHTPQVITVGNHRIKIEGQTITLLGSKGSLTKADGQVHAWADLINQHGALAPTLSQIRLSKNLVVGDDEEIIGTIQYDSNYPNRVSWQIDPDTLPSNTLGPVRALIDPLRTFPNGGLDAAAVGQRYLLVNGVGNSTQAWGSLVASENDIIEYTNQGWQVIFDASAASEQRHYLVNLNKGKQLKWTGDTWVMAIDGDYAPGYWRLVL